MPDKGLEPLTLRCLLRQFLCMVYLLLTLLCFLFPSNHNVITTFLIKRALLGIQLQIVELTRIVMVLFAVDLDERFLLLGAEDNVTHFFAKKNQKCLSLVKNRKQSEFCSLCLLQNYLSKCHFVPTSFPRLRKKRLRTMINKSFRKTLSPV